MGEAWERRPAQDARRRFVAVDDRLRKVEIELALQHQRVEEHEADMVRFASVVTELHEVRWNASKVVEGLDAAHSAIRELSGRLDREREERIRGQAERKRELEDATAARNAEVAGMEERREQQIREINERAERAKQENRRMMFGLIGIFLTSAAAVLAPLLSGGHP